MTRPQAETIGIGLVGAGFMGCVHSHAWQLVPRFFPPVRRPRLVAVADTRPSVAQKAATRFGWAHEATSYRELLERDDVEVIDICVPGDLHAEVAIAALNAGKHVICEKPLSNTVAEAEAMTDAARRAAAQGVLAAVGYTYRQIPAVKLMRQLVAEGRVGTINQVRTHYLQDWLVDPEFPLTWRLDRSRAGAGALSDLGAHIIDLAEFVTGERIAGVSASLRTIVEERPQLGPGGVPDAALPKGRVTVDDAVLFTGRLEGGATGAFEASRFAGGHENSIRLEVNGSKGSLTFEFDAANQVRFWDRCDDAPVAGWRTVVAGDPDPATTKWWPPGHDYAFVAQLSEFVSSIDHGALSLPTFADGLHVQRVIDAVQASGATRSVWTEVLQ